MNNKELKLEAEKYYKENVEGEPLTYETPIHCFIAGATSKYVEKQKLEFAIEQLNKLYTTLQEKYRILTSLHKENVGKMREQHLRNKKAGISVAKEEIRRNIKELEQQLNDL